MATTGKIFSDSSNIYQDQARLLFNYYEQAAERIVRQEEALEKQIKELEEDREQVELKKSDIWKWFLTIVAFFMYWVRKNEYDRQIEAINEKIAEKEQEHKNIFRDYKVTKMGVAYVPVAQQMADTLRAQKCDIVICLSHMGTFGKAPEDICDTTLVAHTRGIDAVIGGHTHKLYDNLHIANLDGDSIPVVQMAKSGVYLGKTVLFLSDKIEK